MEDVNEQKKDGRGSTENSIKHRFQKGQSGNPLGRPAAGSNVTEWINVMSRWKNGKARVERVLSDPTATPAKIQAARTHLLAMEGNARAMDQIHDRTVGKPVQTVKMDANVKQIQHNAPSDEFLRRCNAFPPHPEAPSN